MKPRRTKSEAVILPSGWITLTGSTDRKPLHIRAASIESVEPWTTSTHITGTRLSTNVMEPAATVLAKIHEATGGMWSARLYNYLGKPAKGKKARRKGVRK